MEYLWNGIFMEWNIYGMEYLWNGIFMEWNIYGILII
jgi:hypothetical protein